MSQQLFANVKIVVFDFDGVFTDNFVYVNQEGVESVRCFRSDGIGLSRLRSIGIQSIIVSTEVNPVVTARAKKLKLECIQAVEDKGAALQEISKRHNVPLSEIAFVGNDINDLPALKIVGVPVAVADSYPEILPFTKFVTTKPGGMGAVREICDLIYLSKNLS